MSTKGIINIGLTSLGVALSLLPQDSYSGEKTIHCRANLFVIEQTEGSDKKVMTYSPKEPPGQGKELRLITDASAPTAVLVAAFDGTTGLLLGQTPPVLSIKNQSYSSISFPSDEFRISYGKKEPIDFFVVTMMPNSPELPELKQLIAAIQHSSQSGATEKLALQGRLLKRRIDQWIRSANLKDFTLRNPEPATAGLRRGTTIAWQEHAHSFQLSSNQPVVRRFSAGSE